MPENQRMTKAAGVVGSSTFLSRIFGYIRDMIFAWFFGAGVVSDAFIAAFQIPNLLRRLFGEGSLTISFIPVFTEYLTKRGKQEAFLMAYSALRILSVILVLTAVLGILVSPLIVKLIAPGFDTFHDKYSLTVLLTRIMFPYIIFICLLAFCMGILNAMGHFAAPSLAPVFLNISMIGALCLVSLFTVSPERRVLGFAVGVLAGGFLQLLLQIPFLIKKGFNFRIKGKVGFIHPALKKIGISILPAIFSASVYQIGSLTGKFLASFLPDGSISYLYYADRLAEFPLGVFGLAVATAAFPGLSRQAAEKDFDALKNTFIHSITFVLFLSIPSMVGLIVLREPIVILLFKRGAFDLTAARLTADALLFYGISIWAVSASRIIVFTFYAVQDTKTPVIIAGICVAANFILGIILMNLMAYRGIALALSISQFLNLGLLMLMLKIEIDPADWGRMMISICKILLCSGIMGIIVWKLSMQIISPGNEIFIDLLQGVAISVLAGMLVYAIAAYALRIPHISSLLQLLPVRIKRR